MKHDVPFRARILLRFAALRRHSGARAKRASPESITTAADYGFRASSLRSEPGMTAA